MTYGQSGTGKSHTLGLHKGTEGVIPNSIRQLFHKITNLNEEKSSLKYSVEVEFKQIYIKTK
jgi:predicted ABC-type transport system involved in lysophospholipase L1 biosynthesis ATPase subunit